MPCPLFVKGTRISNPSISPRAPGVLRPLVARPHPCLHTAHRWLRSPLQAISGLRGSFRAVEEAIMPGAPYTGGVTISSGRSRNMAHRRDRIHVRYPEEDVRRLAFGVVLHGGRPPSRSCSDGSSRVRQCPFEETPKLAPTEPSGGR